MSTAGNEVSDWDATKYARVSTPQREWSKAVISRLDLEGSETVVDAGCGSAKSRPTFSRGCRWAG